MDNKLVALALGALTGVVSLIAMVRLVAGAFHGSMMVWGFVLLAMIPWVGYVAWRARHGHLSQRAGLAVLVLGAVGLVSVWLFTLGAVVGLACSFAAFAIIWVSDWPPRRTGDEARLVHIDELATDEADAG